MAQLKPVDAERKSKFPSLYGKESVAAIIERKELESLDVEPGPGAYFGPDSSGFGALGNQRFSKSRSEPSVSFARTGWHEWRGVFVTKQHRPAKAGDDVPGADTYFENYMEQLSTMNGESGVEMPKANRFPKKAYSSASPGPAYDIRGKHAKDVTTITKKNNAARWGKADRWESGIKKDINIGPGQYDRKDTAIKMDYATAKSFGLGFEAYERVICPGWEKAGQGKLSKGPGPPLWRDPLNARDVKTHLIPKAGRWARSKADEVPGPGHYDREEQDSAKVTLEGCSLAQVPNPASVKFGKPSTKPRFRQKLLITCKNAGW
eukprot:CAMPEP_0178994934 /NCGR_PEP_ID=MMETSP0795-20121207/7564_1 /TAXON_ID=88552 /ORGANISM="Amoebophrya sp., Strain Ameob2" /LENGTH=319 /DNA_ID=CAMNT_0020687219 /DNA_START=268 /DNA_END=1224 /DNA_ORIENTATION=+